MYSITHGLVHPKLYDNNISQYTFCDIGKNLNSVDLVNGLMKSVLNPSNNNDIVKVFYDFFEERCITSRENKQFQDILAFFIEYHKWYMGKKKSAFNFYLVKKNDEGQVIDVLNVWKTYREVSNS